MLRRAKPPPKNFDSNVFKAPLALKNNPVRIVLSDDKGNCVVVMEKHEALLHYRHTYSVLKSDPTRKIQRSETNVFVN